jgi:hypothetical protein
LGETQLLSLHLQSKSLYVSAAIDLVQTLIDTLKEWRDSEEVVNKLYMTAEEKSRNCDINIITEARSRTRKIPAKFKNAIVMETVGREEVRGQPLFRTHVYIAVLDCFISELESRFSIASSAAMQGIHALTPGQADFLNIDILSNFAQVYHANIEDIVHEIHQLKWTIQRTEASGKVLKLSTALDLIKFIEPYKVAFHEFYKLLNIAIVLPVTSAACERHFSALKLIKTHLRTTMCDSRLSNIALLSIESGRAKSLDLNQFVDEFDAQHKNKRLTLH